MPQLLAGTGRHRRRRGSGQESQRGVNVNRSPSTFNGERDIPAIEAIWLRIERNDDEFKFFYKLEDWQAWDDELPPMRVAMGQKYVGSQPFRDQLSRAPAKTQPFVEGSLSRWI